jgi:hypothetical protein
MIVNACPTRWHPDYKYVPFSIHLQYPEYQHGFINKKFIGEIITGTLVVALSHYDEFSFLMLFIKLLFILVT